MSYPLKKEKKITYNDYLILPDDNRFEIIEGILYMTPSPSTQHQRVVGRLYNLIVNYLKENTCEVFISPLDVLLPENDEETGETETTVQPDVFVVCDNSKITEKYCLGAPDFIIEVVSPSTPSKDYVKKLNIYEKHKVKEYWIVNYTRKDILVYRLQQNEEYKEPEFFLEESNIQVGIFDGLIINMKEIFE